MVYISQRLCDESPVSAAECQPADRLLTPPPLPPADSPQAGLQSRKSVAQDPVPGPMGLRGTPHPSPVFGGFGRGVRGGEGGGGAAYRRVGIGGARQIRSNPLFCRLDPGTTNTGPRNTEFGFYFAAKINATQRGKGHVFL